MEDTNMKKTYINPELLVVKIASRQHIMAGSPVSFDDLGGGGIKPIDDDPDDGDAMSREFDDFEMEDEEL